MRRLLARRAIQAVVIVWLVASLTFFLLHLAPGDPVSAALGNSRVPHEVREHWRTVLGLDRPVSEQYWRYLVSVARGDLGYSFSHQLPVSAVLADAIPRTLLLMGAALAASFLAGITMGVAQARRRGTPLDWGLGAVSLLFYSMPDFWLALMVLLIFAYLVPLFPATGICDPVLCDYFTFWQRLGDRLRHLVLPAGTLTLLTAAGIARYQRAAVLDVAREDFVRTARAKGVDERAITLRHVLRNALLPIITLLGIALPALLGGSVFVEKIFAWPGMGYITVNAIATRDYPLVTAAVIVGSAMVVVGSAVA